MRRTAAAQVTFDGLTGLALLALLASFGLDSQPATAQGTTQGDDGAPDVAAAGARSGGHAQARLEPTRGHSASGLVDFTRTPEGLVIDAQLTGLSPGPHGIHIHEFGDCSAPDASSAGDHFSPDDSPHGPPDAPRGERHAGDLGNIDADESGRASKRMTDSVLDLDGELGVVGLAIVVHANEDDLSSQPSGESGDPVACGVIELVDAGRG